MTAAHALQGTGRTESGWCAFCTCGEASWGKTRREAHGRHRAHALAAARAAIAARKAAVGPPAALVVSLAMWAGIARLTRAVIG